MHGGEYCLNQGYAIPNTATIGSEEIGKTTITPELMYMHYTDTECAQYYVWSNINLSGPHKNLSGKKPKNYETILDKAAAATSSQNAISINTPQNRRFCL